MRVRIDRETDTPYLGLDESAIAESEEVEPGVIPDYDGIGREVGVKSLRVSDRASQEDLTSIQLHAA